jgi:multidrug resistance efflux pump
VSGAATFLAVDLLARLARLALPALSVAGVFASVGYVAGARGVEEARSSAGAVPGPGGTRTLAATGIVEPAGERTVSIGPTVPGVVLELYASVGEVVSAGAPLFRLDDRDQRDEREVRRAALEAARARLARLEALPRREELAPARARVEQMEAALADQRAQLARVERALRASKGVVSLDELDQRRYRALGAAKALDGAKAELALLEAGAWLPDLVEARASVAEAEAALRRTEGEIERATVRSPLDATVLEVNVREGVYAEPRSELVLLGDTRSLDVRVFVDDESVPLVRPGARATCALRGLPGLELPLAFVRIEPFVRPARPSAGSAQPGSPARSLEAVYRLEAAPVPIYVGQEVGVSLEVQDRERVARDRAER